jgi:hypothetical protein
VTFENGKRKRKRQQIGGWVPRHVAWDSGDGGGDPDDALGEVCCRDVIDMFCDRGGGVWESGRSRTIGRARFGTCMPKPPRFPKMPEIARGRHVRFGPCMAQDTAVFLWAFDRQTLPGGGWGRVRPAPGQWRRALRPPPAPHQPNRVRRQTSSRCNRPRCTRTESTRLAKLGGMRAHRRQSKPWRKGGTRPSR